MIVRKAAAALAVGCTVVVKPAEDTPLTALALAQTSQEAGLPNGVFNVIPADRTETAEISKFLCDSHDVDCISFTGSTDIGKVMDTLHKAKICRILNLIKKVGVLCYY
uniref:Aldedh domain-containing protein n=1 Tax=Globodera pallida TaxID=36090 RepID=A0A183C4W7_GLOPA